MASDSRHGEYFANCVLQGITELCQCSGEGVTSLSVSGWGRLIAALRKRARCYH